MTAALHVATTDAPLEDAVTQFKRYLVDQGLAPKTIRVYSSYYARIVRYCAENRIDLDTVGGIGLGEMAEAIAVPSSASRRHFRTALKHYYDMTGRLRAPLKAVRVPRRPRMLCKALELDEAAALVGAASGWYPEGTAVFFGLYLALRCSEIAQAQWGRFSDDFTVYTVTGKGDVTATLPVHPDLRTEIMSLPRSGDAEGDYIFPGHCCRPYVTPTTVWAWVKKVSNEAGIGDVNTHRLRHTCLATANENLGDLRAVMEFARHTRPEVTAAYTRTSWRQLEMVVGSLDYL